MEFYFFKDFSSAVVLYYITYVSTHVEYDKSHNNIARMLKKHFMR